MELEQQYQGIPNFENFTGKRNTKMIQEIKKSRKQDNKITKNQKSKQNKIN